MENLVNEVSAGGVLVYNNNGITQALLIKIRYYGYELPKGHIETGESQSQAAARELCEETSLLSKPELEAELGNLEYTFRFDNKKIHKVVYYFLFTVENNKPEFGKKPKEVKEIRWISEDEVERIPLVNEKLRPIIKAAFEKSV